MNKEEIVSLVWEYFWAVEAFVVIFLTLLFHWFVRRGLTRLERRFAETTATPWDEAVVAAIRAPLSSLVWLLGIAFAIQIVREATHAPIFDAVDILRDLGVIGIFCWALLNLVQRGEHAFSAAREAAGKPVDRGLVQTIGKLLRISVFITSTLVALQTMGYSISGLLAFGGVGGIAVGFAAKDLLANFFGGLMIFLDRPFLVGDWIRSPDKEIEGTVEHISWRLTRIRTFDKRPLYVPNATFSNITVENPSRMTHRRIFETVGIRYQDAPLMAVVLRDVKAMLKEHPEIDSTQTMIVNFNRFGASSLDFFIYTFTHTTDWVTFHEIKQDVLLKVYEVIVKHGADIAFPTSTLHIIPEAETPTGPATGS